SYGNGYNSIITNDTTVMVGATPIFRAGPYDISQIRGYTMSNIGEGRRLPQKDYANVTFPYHGLRDVNINATMTNPPSGSLVYTYPADAYPYFQSGSVPNTARQKDGFILISAGADRVYGTRDDIVNFGTVGE
ncbi:MAG: hypothetical protein ACREJC_06595, partial [Tepidisphaeraceae bacterium]